MTGPGLAPDRTPPFPWAAFIAFGLGEMRLSPDVLWRLTPREIAALLQARAAPSGPRPMSRDDLQRLAALYPDTTTGDHP